MKDHGVGLLAYQNIHFHEAKSTIGGHLIEVAAVRAAFDVMVQKHSTNIVENQTVGSLTLLVDVVEPELEDVI